MYRAHNDSHRPYGQSSHARCVVTPHAICTVIYSDLTLHKLINSQQSVILLCSFFFFSSRRRHTRCSRDWSSDVCSSDLGAHLARHARHFRSKPVQLVHHRVDGLLQLQQFAFDANGDFSREIATRHGRCNLGDVAHLVGQVWRHRVHIVRQIFPGTPHALDLCLATQLALRTHFARHACHFRGEGVELIHHRVDGVFRSEERRVGKECRSRWSPYH